MSPHIQTSRYLIVGLKTLTLLLGGLITYFSYTAYRRTRSPALRALAIGFGLVTVGSILAGVVDLALGLPIEVSLLVESTLTALGFAVIVYSLYARE
ncbi:MAG: hypothetical protein ABEI57_05025 [Halapricum sp.]